MNLKRYLGIIFCLLLSSCSLNNQDNIKSIGTKIQSDSLRNDIQYINTDKQKYCRDKFRDENNITLYEVKGISMTPTLSEGDIVVCDNSIKEYKSGMIISFEKDNVKSIHRIKATYINYLITQGDNNIKDDGHIEFQEVKCVIIGVCL